MISVWRFVCLLSVIIMHAAHLAQSTSLLVLLLALCSSQGDPLQASGENQRPPATVQDQPKPEDEKRAWQDLSGGWGKRAWKDLGSAWGKRDLDEDKRAWQDLNGGWGKRAWKNLGSSWGKRDWQDMDEDKRAWQDLNGGWGKRAWRDLGSAWGKRGWQDLQVSSCLLKHPQLTWLINCWNENTYYWNTRDREQIRNQPTFTFESSSPEHEDLFMKLFHEKGM